MPIIKFHAVEVNQIVEVSNEMQNSLAEAFNTSSDNITIEVISSCYISSGEVEQKPVPMVEILSFKREKNIEDAAVKVISNLLAKIGYDECDAYFIYLSPSGYYVNGNSIE